MNQFFKIVLCLVTILVVGRTNTQAAVQSANSSDSLIALLRSANEDTSQVAILNQLTTEFVSLGKYDKALQYAQGALKLSQKLAFKKGEADANSNIGNAYWYLGNYDKALEYYLSSFNIWNELNDNAGIAASYNRIGITYIMQGDYEKALKVQLKSLKIREDLNDKRGMANTYNSIGVIYWKKGDLVLAIENYTSCLRLWEELGDKKGLAAALNNIGIIYNLQANYDKALEIYLNCLKAHEQLGDRKGVAQSYNNIASIYYDKGNELRKQNNPAQAMQQYEKSLEYHFKSLSIRLEIKDQQGVAMSHTNIGNVYEKKGVVDEAFYHLERSLTIFKELGDKDGMKETYASLATLYSNKRDFKKAFEFHKLFVDIKDSLLNEQSNRQIAEMNIKYDSEKKDKDLIKKDAEITRQQAEMEKKAFQRNAFIAGFILILILAFFIYRSYSQKKAANLELEEKNNLIEKQKKLVEEKNEKITDSITYAKRIQQATLPSKETIKSAFSESFVLFLPKDIVSGDFYWHSTLATPDSHLLVVADCTGHGVPGAFMSMIGNTLLNEIVNVKGIHAPADILNELNKGIVNLLNQSSDSSDTQDDGMDVTIVAINKSTYEIEYAAANHFSYISINKEIKQLKGDVFSIGGMFGSADIKFTSQKLKVEKGSILYLFTDGYIDQFGGDKNTKFSSARLESLLNDVKGKTIEEQEKAFLDAFNDWKSTNKQLDDVLVVGIQI